MHGPDPAMKNRGFAERLGFAASVLVASLAAAAVGALMLLATAGRG